MKGYRIDRVLGAAVTGILVIPILLALPTKAYGYTDPGTGQFAYQAIYAAIIGGAFYFRKFVRRIFGKRSDK